MTYQPDSRALSGTALKVAELMGKPHIGCRYRREDYRSHGLLDGARCAVCGSLADDAHHVVPRGRASGFTLNTPLGRFVLMSPLFAVCRNCHDGFASGFKLDAPRFEVSWVWDTDSEPWWSGRLLAHGWQPHDHRLFDMGHYALLDAELGTEKELRG